MGMRRTTVLVLATFITVAGVSPVGTIQAGESKRDGGEHHGTRGGKLAGKMHKAFCPMKTPGVAVQVEHTKDGVTLKLSAPDAKTAKQLQLRADIVQLMHELRELEKDRE